MAKAITKKINSQFNPNYVGNYPVYAFGGRMKKNLGGSIAGGALQGAQAGMALGPWGAAAGTVIGGVTGLISGKKQQKEAAAIEAAEQRQKNAMLASNLPGQPSYIPTFASGGKIYIKPSKRGTFTAAAKKRNMGVQEFASKVLGNKENYSSAMVKKANFARNASKWKADGGPLDELKQHNLVQGKKGAKAARKATAKFAKDYMQPATIAATSALMGPSVLGALGKVGQGAMNSFKAANATGATDLWAVDQMAQGAGHALKATPFTLLNEYLHAKAGSHSSLPGLIGTQPFEGLNDRSIEELYKTNMLPNVDVIGNKKAFGGSVSNSTDRNYVDVQAGGTHEGNPNGGVPIGKNALVEEDEFIWDGPEGKYVFSNRF